MSGKDSNTKETASAPKGAATTDTTDAIDSAVNQALQKVRAKGTGDQAGAGEGATDAGSDKPKKAKLTDEERAAKQAERDAERAQKKAEREAKKAAKQLEREASKKPAHLSKVNKAGEKLPKLNDSAQEAFDSITSNFAGGQVAAIALHLTHFNRVKATERALTQKLNVGDTVRIVGGDPRFIGEEATVTKAQRIRCYCSVEGTKKDVYLFTSDCEIIAPAAAKKTGTEG